MTEPWFKFFPTDWRGDAKLRMCSIAARGLWAEMLCVMHEADPYGHLMVNGQAVAPAQMAALAGITAKECTKLTAELGAAGVYSTTDAGVIFSRRMVRDKARKETNRKNGRGGGNPNLTNSDNRPDNQTAEVSDNRKSQISDKPHIPEARIQKDSADADRKGYAFDRGVIRLNHRDFERWKADFPQLDLQAELASMVEWAKTLEKGRWFHAVQQLLTKRNREAKIAKDRGHDQPAFKWNGIEGVV